MPIPLYQVAFVSALLYIVDITFDCITFVDVLDHKFDAFAETIFLYILLQTLEPKLYFEPVFSMKNEIPKINYLIDFLRKCARTV